MSRWLSISFAWLLLANLAVPAETGPAKVNFDREIRPLLADRCLACHGADEHHREGSLRLDQREAALRGGDSGEAAIVPGNPQSSELIRRILSADENEQMPPPSSKKSLTPQQRELLARWIREGAEYQQHWAFIPPVRPTVPVVQDTTWPRNDIDRFVLARLEREHLNPAPRADRPTLLRRLTLDLTGLPPTPEELDAFLADDSPQADDRAIERLLDSPHHGERWGRLWLDGARYADSDGYEKDKPRFVWAYRDWVVNALNRNMPYDQFLIEQLAGDLLPHPTQDQIVATGFLRNSMINEEGGTDPEQFRMEAMFDRMDAIGKSMLGLTIQCCQCHNHKYDPISQREYYQLFAFFNDTFEASLPVYMPDQQMERQRIFEEISRIEESLRQRHPHWEAELTAWEAALPREKLNWQFVAPKQEVSGGEKHYVLKDHSILAQGYAPSRSTIEFEVETPVETVASVRLELLNHPDLPLGGPGRAIDGTCALSEFQIELAPRDGSKALQPAKISSASADVNLPEQPLDARFDDKTNRKRVTGPIAMAIDNKKETAWGINIGPGRSNVPHEAVFVLENPPAFAGGTRIKFKLVEDHGGWNSNDNQNNNLGRFRFSVATEVAKKPLLPVVVQRVLDKAPDARTAKERSTLFSYWRTTVPEFAAENAKIEALWMEHPVPTSQLVMRPREEHRETFVLTKGNFLQPTEEVKKNVPSMLHPLRVENPTRLDFARWLVDPKSPTVARSIVNRVWQTYFGIGLVATSEDFGMQGDPPSHPELLDWLAVEFMESGWNLKKLHRMIVHSATYQQCSDVTPELLARDPENRLLARGARFRMEAEGVRDVALAVSGLLNREVGGPPVYPPCPEFLLLPPASYGTKVWPKPNGGEQYRRAIYTFRFRSVPYPALQVFDAPVGEVACVRRVKSNTPLQALASLNEPVFVDCARGLAKLALENRQDGDEARLSLAFRRATSRAPEPRELATLQGFLQKQRQRLAQGNLSATNILGKSAAPSDANGEWASLEEQAVWTAVCRVILNLDETITRN
jgi:hypothetical protein